MSRIRLTALALPLLASAWLAAVAVAAAPVGRPGQLVRHATRARAVTLDSATLSACTTGLTADDRAATFSATMDAVPGTSTMSISFTLYERIGTAGGFVQVSAPRFGVWQSSSPGIASYTLNQDVVDLPAPAAFRALVRYRWLSRSGRVIRRDARLTPACVTSAPEPDLVVVRISAAPGTQSRTSSLYDVLIRNLGRGAAGPFEVAFSVGASALADQQVAGLAPQASTTVQFAGPRCAASAALTAQVDPAGVLSERANPRRSLTIACAATRGSRRPN